ncbi:MAG: HAMP domain-containing sensor histidine kinase [Bacteroidales bacterium]
MRYISIFILLFSISFSAFPKSNRSQISAFLDSSYVYTNSAEEVPFLLKALEISIKNNDLKDQSAIYRSLTRNSYNRWLPDSVQYWGDLGLNASRQADAHNELIDILSLMCFRDLFFDEYENATEKATELFRLGKELNHPSGMISSYEAMGMMYRQTSRPGQALIAFNEGLNLIREAGEKPSHEMQFLSYIIDIMLSQGKVNEVEGYIEDYLRMNENYAQNKYKNQGTIPVERCRWLGECYLTDLFIQRKDYEKAKEHYLASCAYTDIEDVYVKYYFDLNTISYYQYISKDYNKALALIDQLLVDENRTEILQKKADILYDMGQFKNSISTYRDLIHLKDSVHDFELTSQLNDLRSRLEVNKLELATKDLEAKKNELRLRIFILSFIFAVIILIFLAVILIRTAIVKNILAKSEQELKIAKEKAEESNHLKTVFIQNMSHEIRTPLNAIVGFSSLLAEMPEERAEFTKIIEENSSLLLKLVDDMLNISMIETNKHTSFDMKLCDVEECCQSAIASVMNKVKEPVKLTFTPHQYPLKISTDPHRLHQVLTNLLTNASKFTTEGEINLTYLKDEPNRVRFMVTDTGIGIPAEKREEIFGRFVKLDDFKQGVGLGLYICLSIVTGMHGRIFVDPSYDDGARFIVDLPLHHKKE